jgi:hypothetical protein
VNGIMRCLQGTLAQAWVAIAAQPKPGKVIELCPQAKNSPRIRFGRLMRNSALRLSLLRSSHRSPYVELRIAREGRGT